MIEKHGSPIVEVPHATKVYPETTEDIKVEQEEASSEPKRQAIVEVVPPSGRQKLFEGS